METIWIQFKIPKSRPITIGGVYRPPSASVQDSINDLEAELDFHCQNNETILMEDFNLDYFKAGARSLGNSLERNRQFKQLIIDPTRITAHSRTTINLIFTNNNNKIGRAHV